MSRLPFTRHLRPVLDASADDPTDGPTDDPGGEARDDLTDDQRDEARRPGADEGRRGDAARAGDPDGVSSSVPAWGTAPRPRRGGDPRDADPADPAGDAGEPGSHEGLLGEGEHGDELAAGDALADPEGLLDQAGPAGTVRVVDEAGRPVDGHLVPAPRPTFGQRLAARQAGGTGEREPIVPAWARDRQLARDVLGRTAGTLGYAAGYRAVRAPWDAVKVAWWALAGARRLSARLLRWLFDVDGHPLIGEVQARDDRAYVRMAHDRTVRQKWRFTVLAVMTVLALVTVAFVRHYAPAWVLPVLLLAAVVGLARHGKPVGVAMFTPAVRKEVKVPLTSQAIVQALSVLGIGLLTKSLAADSSRIWRSGIAAVRGGHRVQIQLPLGVLANDLIPHEQRMAHALGRQADCVIVEPLPDRTPGDLVLHVLDKPVLAGRRGPGPLAKARKASWFSPVVVGLTRAGVVFTLAMRGGAWFIGGQPNAGKSSLLKLAAAHTALDPGALLTIVNLKGSPDYVGLKPVCHRYLSGAPETNPGIIAETHRLLAWVLDDAARRNDFLTSLVERGLAESADVTPELAAKYKELRPHTVIVDEVHRLFDKSDNPQAEETAELLGKVIKAVRSVGDTLICATQLAGGESVPPALVRASRVRGCLTVQDEVSFRQIYGNAGRGIFSEMAVASLPQGTVLLKAEDGGMVKVGTYYLDTRAMADIGKRAHALRSQLHLLTGQAAGEDVDDAGERVDPADLLRDLLRDLLTAIPTTAPTGGRDDADVAWLTDLETALDAKPVYGGRGEGWLAAELRARGIPTRPVNRRLRDDAAGASGRVVQRNNAGLHAGAVRAALEHHLTTQPVAGVAITGRRRPDVDDAHDVDHTRPAGRVVDLTDHAEQGAGRDSVTT